MGKNWGLNRYTYKDVDGNDRFYEGHEFEQVTLGDLAKMGIVRGPRENYPPLCGPMRHLYEDVYPKKKK